MSVSEYACISMWLAALPHTLLMQGERRAGWYAKARHGWITRVDAFQPSASSVLLGKTLTRRMHKTPRPSHNPTTR